MDTKHTISDVLQRLVVDIDNMNSFLYSLQNILESQSENVTVSQTKADGSLVNITVPSFGYLKGKIEDINTKFDTLISANGDVIGIKSSNGDVRKFELKKTAQLIQDLEDVQNSTFDVPSLFKVKNNWFFESFLNPLLYVNVDITSVLTDDIDQFVVKRIIVNAANDDDAAAFFDTNYKGLNNIDLDTLKQDLDDNAIDYFEDDNVVDLDVAVNRFRGSFDVVGILEEEGNQTLASGQTVSTLRRRYKLSTLNYTDIVAGVQNTRVISIGDVLITDGDSEYRVVSLNATDTEVVLEKIFGTDSITIGANVLRLKPSPYRTPALPVNVGFNEREAIFVKPVSKAKNLTIDGFSKGFAIYTNDLTIPLPDNSSSTLEDYYNNFVSDFGLILLNLAKEKVVPTIIGEIPNSPNLFDTNFSVIQVDAHIQDDKNVTELNNNIKEKASLQQEVDELNKKIDTIKSTITTVAKTEKEARRLQKQLTTSINSRNEKVTALTTLVNNITLQLSTTPQFIVRKKYRVRGFWQIPDAKVTKYGPQQIVQFKYRYRYLSVSGTQPNATQQSFIDSDGATKTATFSPWTEELTRPRVKELDPETGLYVWVDEILNDADAVNTNQLSIPIRKGEIVEIQVKSLSEAGWPSNPVESVWSNSAQIQFPAEIQSEEEATLISQKAYAEKVRIDFENNLNSKGLDVHTANQFTQGDKFYGHIAEDIASGFFTNEGNVVDLYQKLKSLQSTLDGIQTAITTDRGAIKVRIIDSEGNSLDVSNGDTISLFGGYYKDLIKDTTGGTVIYNEGDIITKQYAVSIQNTSATNLELISLLFGGINELATTSNPLGNPDNDYQVNRRYDIVPIGVNSNPTPQLGKFKQRAGAQSGQVKSQFIHSRIREYGLSEEIYAPTDPATDFATYFTVAYNYQGRTVNTTNFVPANWGHYLPFNPQYAGVPGTATNLNVWNGTTTAASPTVNANGGGYLTEFCISKDHPELPLLGPSFSIANIAEAFRPDFGPGGSILPTASQQYLPFAHALHFETSLTEDTNAFGVKYYKQVSRITPDIPTNNVTDKDESHYPIKLGFKNNDKYLIGKYTCGAYLYMYPTNYESVSVEGNFPARSTKIIKFGEENSVNIPILFQFRASDRLGYIGGYRTTTTLTNIKYSKKLGIDIIIKDESPFSFDIQVDAQYIKETSLDSPLVQSRGTRSSF
jgi:hypothetical protein